MRVLLAHLEGKSSEQFADEELQRMEEEAGDSPHNSPCHDLEV